jgi:hypothetical protein
MSDFDVLVLPLLFAVLGAGVLFVLKFIAGRLHHEASPYGPSPDSEAWMKSKSRGDGDGPATSAGGRA